MRVKLAKGTEGVVQEAGAEPQLLGHLSETLPIIEGCLEGEQEKEIVASRKWQIQGVREKTRTSVTSSSWPIYGTR